MGDYDFTGVFVAMTVIGIAVGAVGVAVLWWLCHHLSVVVRWV